MCLEKNTYALIVGYGILYMSASPILLMGYSNLQSPYSFHLLELSVIERKRYTMSGFIHPCQFWESEAFYEYLYLILIPECHTG